MKAVLTAYLTLLLLSATAVAQPAPPSPAAPPSPDLTPSWPPVHLICFHTENNAAGKTGFVYAIPGDAPTNAYSILYPTIGQLKMALMQHRIAAFDLETNLNFASSGNSIQRPLTANEIAILLRPLPLPPALPIFKKPPTAQPAAKP